MNVTSCSEAEEAETIYNISPWPFSQDKAQPETQATVFGDVSFKATLAQDTPGGLPLVKQPGSDGFTLSSSPLFQVGVRPVKRVHNFTTAQTQVGYYLYTTVMQTIHLFSIVAHHSLGASRSDYKSHFEPLVGQHGGTVVSTVGSWQERLRVQSRAWGPSCVECACSPCPTINWRLVQGANLPLHDGSSR